MSLLERSKATAMPIVVQFHAPWCGPCRALSPQVDRMEKAYEGKVEVWRVDVDQDPDAAREMGIRSVPTLVILKDGQELSRVSGYQGPAALENLFATALRDGQDGVLPAPQDAALPSAGIERFRTPATLLGFALLFASNTQPGLHWLFWLSLPLVVWGMANACPLCAVGTRGVGKLLGRR